MTMGIVGMIVLNKPNFFVLTGGPGVGKTAVIRHLASLGEFTVEENARAVIREQEAVGGPGVPWRDGRAFCDLTTALDIADFDRLAGETRRVFFDRGIMDMYDANGVPPSPVLTEALRTKRYNRRVFLFPPWPEIYETDAERRQDWAEAERTFDLIRQRLPELGYELIVVPKGGLGERVQWLLDAATRK